MSGNDGWAGDGGAGTALAPHDINRLVAGWSIAVAGAEDTDACREIELRLADEPEAVRARIRPLLAAKRAELARPAPTVRMDDRTASEGIGELAWVSKTLRLILQSNEGNRPGRATGNGLVPLGFLRDGGDVLREHRVVIRDQFKGNRTALFAQSGKGKTNLVKVVLFWTLFNRGYGKLIFDYKGEYVPWTQNERGEDVPGLCEHPLAKELVVLYTTKERHIQDRELNTKVTVRPLKIHLRSILPRDFALFWPNLTKAQEEFLFTYDEDPSVYETILGEEKGWHKLSAWFGDSAKVGDDAEDEGPTLEASGKRVVRNIRKKLQAAQKRPYVVDSSVRIDERPDGTLALHTPFNASFVEQLKQAIPNRLRQWDGDAKVWIVDGARKAQVEQLVGEVFGSAEADSLGQIGQDLAAGKLVVVDFSGIGSEQDRDLIAMLVTRRQFEHNLERIDLEEGPTGRIPFVAFFEEAQNLLAADKVRESKNPIFIRTFKEGRALAIGTTSITQQPGALSKDLTSQIAYYIVQHLRSHDDIRNLVAMDPAVEGAESDIQRRIAGNALYVDNDRGFPLPIKIDRFDRAFVDAVRDAYAALEREKTGIGR